MVDVMTLGEIAQLVDARLCGDPSIQIKGLQTLSAADPQQLSFMVGKRYQADLAATQAAAVLVTPAFEAECPVAALVVDDPYLAYARISQCFETRPTLSVGIHPTAVVASDAQVAADACVGPGVVVESGARIESAVEVGPGSVVGARSVLAAGARLAARVVLYHDVEVGSRSIIHSGAVIGADGFGYAPDQQQWHKIAQVGGVVIGCDVEIGANTTIDRGALLPTRIGNGVKIDNQVHIAHNCEIGEDTAIAGCVGIAGSTKIGRRCTIAGGVGIVGHLEIADGVHITAMALITKSLKQKGVYSSGTGTLPYSQWKRNVVRFRQLDKLAGRVAALEASAEQQHKG